MIFFKFSPKNLARKLAFLTQTKGKLCKILIITLVFEKNANLFAENWLKSQKIVIITSTPDGVSFGRILVQWAVVYFGFVLHTLFTGYVSAWILTKSSWVTFWAIFYKLIWSP
jgi:hypothetical protein